MRSKTFGEHLIAVFGLTYAIIHFMIAYIILLNKKLRRNLSNLLLLNLNVTYVFCGLVHFSDPRLFSDGLYIRSPAYFYLSSALWCLTIDRLILIRWPFHYIRYKKMRFICMVVCTNMFFLAYLSLSP